MYITAQNDPYMKRSLQLARCPAGQISDPDCTGFLHKLSARRAGGAHWRPALCVLKDACLYLFRASGADPDTTSQSQSQSQSHNESQNTPNESDCTHRAAPDEQHASAVYYLHGYKVRSKHIEHKKFTFELIPPNRKTIRPILLMAKSETDKKR